MPSVQEQPSPDTESWVKGTTEDALNWFGPAFGLPFMASPAAIGAGIDLVDGLFDDNVDVKAIDDSDAVGKLDALLSHDELGGMGTSADTVQRIIEKAGGRPLGEVEIGDHGSPASQSIGQFDELFPHHLTALAPHMGEGSRLTLGGCNVGDGEAGKTYLRAMAGELGAPVRAGTSNQSPMSPGMAGDIVTCAPTEADPRVVGCHTEHHPISDLMWEGNEMFYNFLRKLQ